MVTFAQSLKTGVMMVLVYSFITALWLAFYQHVINPEYYSLVKQFSIEELKAEGKTELQITEAMKEINTMYSGMVFSYSMYFVFCSVAGSLIAMITSIVIRSRKKVSQ